MDLTKIPQWFGRDCRACLVKKIVVYTQDIVPNRDSLVKIENNKAIVNMLISVNSGLDKGFTFQSISNYKSQKPLKSY